MPRRDCFRKGCTRIQSEFSLFLNRRRPPLFEGKSFCSEACLRAHVKAEFVRRWNGMRNYPLRHFPRPRLGSILMQTAFVTREQLEEAVRLQKQANGEGRLGEWLVRLGFVQERQITLALAKQFGLPVIDLKNSEARGDAVRMVPPQVARSSRLFPVSYDEEQGSLRIAVAGPVNFNLQDALRRMIGKRIATYIGDDSAIEALLDRCYGGDQEDLSKAPEFGSLEEFIEILQNTVSAAVSRKATNFCAELLDRYFWVRLEFGAGSEHCFYRALSSPVRIQAEPAVPERRYAAAMSGS